jgi:D-alanine-D-alanine ligase
VTTTAAPADPVRRAGHAPRRVRVAVIGGGQNCEHDVSLASAASVVAALDPRRYDVVAITITRDGVWTSADSRDATPTASATPAGSLATALTLLAGCDVALPIVHGPRGEDGSLAAVFDLAGIGYVGSGVRAGALAMDKWATKLVAGAVGVRTAPGRLVTRSDTAAARGSAAVSHVRLPLVVKPVAAGSSHGVTRVDDSAGLGAAIELALSLDDRALVEEFVTGREIDVAVLQRVDGSRFVGPALEIVVDDGELFDTTRKYDGGADFRLPADLTGLQRHDLESAALALFDALGCAGVARFDFFLTATGLVLNEVNTMPGMTAESQVPKMFAAAGLPYAALLDELVLGALRTRPR